ncbi:MAG: hypothetical protein QXF35_00220 [Candidatus Bilamarchaeaceae archaeon]
MVSLLAMYKRLLGIYGPQGWWPTIKRGKIHYHPNDYNTPKNERDRFQITIGAILAQGTNWKNAEKALLSLYENNVLDYSSLLGMPIKKLALLIRSSGYYNQKAERIKRLLPIYKKIRKCSSLRESREALLSVKGIGPETADSILLYAFKKPIFVVDAYTLRFCIYYGLGNFKSYNDCQLFFEKNLPKNYRLFNEYHALIVRWGKEQFK